MDQGTRSPEYQGRLSTARVTTIYSTLGALLSSLFAINLLLGARATADQIPSESFEDSLSSIQTQTADATARFKTDNAAPPIAPQQVASQGSDRVSPDFSFTPGRLCKETDPDFQEYRYAEHIPYCKRNVTEAMKEQAAAHYGIAQSDWGNYEFDHLIPLSIGGDSHVDNVWPQPHGPDGSYVKDQLEEQLYLQMKAGTIAQAQAVQQIYAWFNANQAAAFTKATLAAAD